MVRLLIEEMIQFYPTVFLLLNLSFSLSTKSSKFRESLNEIVAKTRENWLKIAEERLKFQFSENVETKKFNPDWSYDRQSIIGPHNWYLSYPKCGDLAQSPIDINPKSVIKSQKKDSLLFKNYDVLSSCSLNISENLLRINVPKGSIVSDTFYRLDYLLINVDLHWGSKNDFGSEHSIGGRTFPLEMQFVHKLANCCPSKSKRIPSTSVLSVLFELNSSDNEHLNPLIRAVVNDRTNVLLNFFNFLPSYPNRYYRYTGSTTRPPCDEYVLWTIFQSKQSISNRQLNSLRRLYGKQPGLRDNLRPIQYLNARKVFDSSSNYSTTITGTSTVSWKPLTSSINSGCAVTNSLLLLICQITFINALLVIFCRP